MRDMTGWFDISKKLPTIFPVEVCHYEHGFKFMTKGIDVNNMAPKGPWFLTNIPGMSMNATHWRPFWSFRQDSSHQLGIGRTD